MLLDGCPECVYWVSGIIPKGVLRVSKKDTLKNRGIYDSCSL